MRGFLHPDDILDRIQKGAEYDDTLKAINEQLENAYLNQVDSIAKVFHAVLDKNNKIARAIGKNVVLAKPTPNGPQLQV